MTHSDTHRVRLAARLALQCIPDDHRELDLTKRGLIKARWGRPAAATINEEGSPLRVRAVTRFLADPEISVPVTHALPEDMGGVVTAWQADKPSLQP